MTPPSPPLTSYEKWAVQSNLDHIKRGFDAKERIAQLRINGYERTADAVEFCVLVAEQQEIQKRHPFGNFYHRRAHDKIREATLAYKGVDIGEYE